MADPPWALGRAQRGSAYRRTYGRRREQVIDGYVEVDRCGLAGRLLLGVGAGVESALAEEISVLSRTRRT